MTRFKTIAIAAFVGLAASSAAIAGMWNNLPKVGSAAYSCGSVNGVSNCTVPAGPSYLTGSETVPADTNLANGQSPQTVIIPTSLLMNNGLAVVDGDATTYTVAAGISNVVLTDSNTITSSTVTAPAAPINGQRVRISANNTVTTFAFAANTGQTLGQTTPTVLTVSSTVPQGFEFIYETASAKWYRMQ